MKMSIWSFFAFILMVHPLFSQDYVENSQNQTRGIVVEDIRNDNSSFFVRVSVDRDDHKYQDGECVQVKVKSSRAGWLYLFYQDASGKVSLLFPNDINKNNKIAANEEILVPNTGSDFRLRVTAPYGKEHLLAVVTKNELEVISKNLVLSKDATTISFNNWKSFEKGLVVEKKIEEANWAEHCISLQTLPKESRKESLSKRYVVSIGIGNYKDQKIPPLKVCGNDAQSFCDLLIKQGSVNKEDTFLLTDDNATLENIRQLFCEELPNKTKPGDILFIYWSGHGGRCADKEGDEKDGYDEYLVPFDGYRGKPNTMLLDDTFGRWTQNLDGRTILFILDACHSGGNVNDEEINEETTVVQQRSGVQTKSLETSGEQPFDFGFNEFSTMKDIGQNNLAVIASSMAEEISLVRFENDHSVMTWFVLEELEKNRNISHKELYKNISPKVQEYVKKSVYPCQVQTVVFYDDIGEDLIINP